MKRIRQECAVSKRGFSRWIAPVMRKYIMACCDCGLVHEMEFNVLAAGKMRKNKSWSAKRLSNVRYRVEFRVRRMRNYTAAERRKMEAKK